MNTYKKKLNRTLQRTEERLLLILVLIIIISGCASAPPKMSGNRNTPYHISCNVPGAQLLTVNGNVVGETPVEGKIRWEAIETVYSPYGEMIKIEKKKRRWLLGVLYNRDYYFVGKIVAPGYKPKFINKKIGWHIEYNDGDQSELENEIRIIAYLEPDGTNRHNSEIVLELLTKKLSQAIKEERWEDAKNIQALIREMTPPEPIIKSYSGTKISTACEEAEIAFNYALTAYNAALKRIDGTRDAKSLGTYGINTNSPGTAKGLAGLLYMGSTLANQDAERNLRDAEIKLEVARAKLAACD